MPYTILIYPFAFMVLPKLWAVSKRHGSVTPADFVRARYGSPSLALVIALTGIMATMPYIALQLVGIQVVIGALGFPTEGFIGELPLIISFIIPAKLLFKPPSADSLNGFSVYATLALGSALALFLYPHSVTAILSSSSGNTIRRNAVLLPAYSLLLGLIALLGCWLDYRGLLAGWAVGIGFGTWVAYQNNFANSNYNLHIGGATIPGYAALYAVVLNIIVCVAVTAIVRAIGMKPGDDATKAGDFENVVEAA